MNSELLNKILPPQMMKDVLYITLIVLLVTVVVLFFFLVFHKLAIELNERRKRRYRARYSAYMRKFLLGRDGTVIRPRTKLGCETLASLCIDKLETSSQEDQGIIRHYIRGSFIVDYFRKMAESSAMPKRFHAIKTLGYFSLDELRQYFKDALMEEKSEEVKGAIVWGMSRIADRSSLDLITMTLASDISLSSKYNEYVYSNLIRSFLRKGIIDQFLAFLEKLKDGRNVPYLLKRDIIEACGSAGLHLASRTIVDFFFSSERLPAIKIACMRALGRLRCPEFSGVVAAALFHEDWRVRSQAALAAARCSESSIPHLRNLLYDDFYHVRINAARSLSRLGDKGLALLRSEMSSKDPFVRDTVHFMLRK
jgi:hypothetical protein